MERFISREKVEGAGPVLAEELARMLKENIEQKGFMGRKVSSVIVERKRSVVTGHTVMVKAVGDADYNYVIDDVAGMDDISALRVNVRRGIVLLYGEWPDSNTVKIVYGQEKEI